MAGSIEWYSSLSSYSEKTLAYRIRQAPTLCVRLSVLSSRSLTESLAISVRLTSCLAKHYD